MKAVNPVTRKWLKPATMAVKAASIMEARVARAAMVGKAAKTTAAKVVKNLNYRRLCIGVLAFLTAMTFGFTGLFGLFLYFVSTVVGLVAPFAGIRRTHAMGVLMLPLLAYYL